ncbi:hypothetical protein HKD37_16G044871 [Glycine soja]
MPIGRGTCLGPPLVDAPDRLPLVVTPGAPPLLVAPGRPPLVVAPGRPPLPPLFHHPVKSHHVSCSGRTRPSSKRFVVK